MFFVLFFKSGDGRRLYARNILMGRDNLGGSNTCHHRASKLAQKVRCGALSVSVLSVVVVVHLTQAKPRPYGAALCLIVLTTE